MFVELVGKRPEGLIPPGIEFSSFSPDSASKERTIAHPGRLITAKSALRAVGLLGELARDIGPIRVLFSDSAPTVSSEWERFVIKLDAALGCWPELKAEFVSGRDAVPQIYERTAMTLVMPLGIEGFGLVPLESIACGRPVVATPTGGMTRISGASGTMTFADRDWNAIKEAIKRMLGDWPP